MNKARCEAVWRAAQVVDDPHVLRRLLGVRMEDLQRWLAGRGYPDDQVFLRAIDIIHARERTR